MYEQEKVISRIRAGRWIGATTDDLYDAIVNQDGIDEGTFFLCNAAAILLEKGTHGPISGVVANGANPQA